MLNSLQKAKLFHRLHTTTAPLILTNIWECGGASALEAVGAKAIATSSHSVAAFHGYSDGELLPLNLAIDNLARIVKSVTMPVSFDMEGGYGVQPEEVAATAKSVMNAGAVGINFEDQIIGQDGLYSIDMQCDRIKAIRDMADEQSIPLFINARTDVFLKSGDSTIDTFSFDEALERCIAYEEAGASGFFVPGLQNIEAISTLCEKSTLPINVMIDFTASPNDLSISGVSRISYGPHPYFQFIEMIKNNIS